MCKFGVPGKDRTCDLRVRNALLFQLSYEDIEYTQRDLNPQPTRYERAALTVELWVHGDGGSGGS